MWFAPETVRLPSGVMPPTAPLKVVSADKVRFCAPSSVLANEIWVPEREAAPLRVVAVLKLKKPLPFSVPARVVGPVPSFVKLPVKVWVSPTPKTRLPFVLIEVGPRFKAPPMLVVPVPVLCVRLAALKAAKVTLFALPIVTAPRGVTPPTRLLKRMFPPERLRD